MSKLRHELKYEISLFDANIIKNRLSKVLKYDAYARPDGTYSVDTLYFDTPANRALYEKIDGIEPRCKFRIRYYNGDLGFIRLEKKMKIRGRCLKQSVGITYEDARDIIAGKRVFGHPLTDELYFRQKSEGLRPVKVVSYTRRAFTYPHGNVRITLDYDIQASNPKRFFAPAEDSIPV